MEPDRSQFNCEEQSCAGHYAGWYWAQSRNINDVSQCGGSGSFQEGCKVYVNQVKNGDTNNTELTALAEVVNIITDIPSFY